MLLYAVFFFVYAEKKDGKYLTCIGDGSEGKKMKITDHDLKTEIESFFLLLLFHEHNKTPMLLDVRVHRVGVRRTGQKKNETPAIIMKIK